MKVGFKGFPFSGLLYRLFLRLVYLFLLSMLVSCPHSKNATEKKDPHSLVLSIQIKERHESFEACIALLVKIDQLFSVVMVFC